MNPARPSPRAALLVAAATALLAAMTLPSIALGQPAPPPATRPATVPASKLKWRDVCTFALGDTRLAFRSDLTVDQMRGLTDEPQELDGLPGQTLVRASARRFEVNNVRRYAEGDVVTFNVTVDRRQGLTLEYRRTIAERFGAKEWRVLFTQEGSDVVRRTGRTNARLRATGPGGPVDGIDVEAVDLATLRKENPHEVNRYLRPMLRRLGYDVLHVDPAAARQVLFPGGAAARRPATSPATAPTTAPTSRPAPLTAAERAIEPEVRDLLAGLDAPQFVRRQSALDRLIRLGPPALRVLETVDRAALTDSQKRALDVLFATVIPLSAAEAQRLRDEPHFLVDCLYATDPAVRSAAADRLRDISKAPAARFARVLAADPQQDPDRCLNLIEGLRDELFPNVEP